MPFEIIRDDLIRQKVDAIVCPTNPQLIPGGGAAAAVFGAAGRRLVHACRRAAPCDTGSAVCTRGYDLDAKYILHTATPHWAGGTADAALLRSCYRSCLALAQEKGCGSVAFPLLGSGSNGWPKDQALNIATGEIGAYLLSHEELTVRLVIFDDSAFTLSARQFPEIQSYVDQHYVSAHSYARNTPETCTLIQPMLADQAKSRSPEDEPSCPGCGMAIYEGASYCRFCGARLHTKEKTTEAPGVRASAPSDAAFAPSQPAELSQRLAHLSDGFSVYLLHLIDRSGKTDAEVYKKANIDRKLFSKIRSNPDYQPGKKTVLAFAIALELNLDDTADLLRRAGFALSPSNKFDLIVSYFIETGNYNIFEINETLFCLTQQQLGA